VMHTCFAVEARYTTATRHVRDTMTIRATISPSA
jgi:hypothetical protein